MWELLIHIYLSIGLLCSGFNILVTTYRRDEDIKNGKLWRKIVFIFVGIFVACFDIVFWPRMANEINIIARILRRDEKTLDYMQKVLNNEL